MSLNQTISELFNSTRSRLCIGIDPPLLANQTIFEENFLQSIEPAKYLKEFSTAVIETCSGVAKIVKFQSAYFEAYGAAGFEALKQSISFAKQQGCFVIVDAKRGDISSTMSAYCDAFYNYFGADCITINPWMGWDTIEPTLPYLNRGKSAFVVWLTSNPASTAIQNTKVSANQTIAHVVFDRLWEKISENKIESNIGYVIGLNRIEDINPSHANTVKKSVILMPGIGGQGLSVDAKAQSFLRTHPLTMQNISRGLYQPEAGKTSSWTKFRRDLAVNLNNYKDLTSI